MNVVELLTDGFDRVRQGVYQAVEGLDIEQLTARVDPDANSIAWLVWHLTRVQDDHLADAASHAQAWLADGWADRFDLPLDPSDTGYGHGSPDVAKVVASGDLLSGYYDAVHEQTLRYLRRLTERDLDRVVDEAWDPPVTLGVRLVSVLNDDTQHVGQAAFIRGMLLRR